MEGQKNWKPQQNVIRVLQTAMHLLSRITLVKSKYSIAILNKLQNMILLHYTVMEENTEVEVELNFPTSNSYDFSHCCSSS